MGWSEIDGLGRRRSNLRRRQREHTRERGYEVERDPPMFPFFFGFYMLTKSTGNRFRTKLKSTVIIKITLKWFRFGWISYPLEKKGMYIYIYIYIYISSSIVVKKRNGKRGFADIWKVTIAHESHDFKRNYSIFW